MALGHVNAGMMGTDQRTMDQMRKNCSVTGEKTMATAPGRGLSKGDTQRDRGHQECGKPGGRRYYCGKFLQEFVEDAPWVHMDIAGMDLEQDGRPFSCKGATGFGVRTLVHLLE